jgi:hypothetical protein
MTNGYSSTALANFVEFGISDGLSWPGEVVSEALPQCFGPASNLGPLSPKDFRLGFVKDADSVWGRDGLADLAKLCERDEELTADSFADRFVHHRMTVAQARRRYLQCQTTPDRQLWSSQRLLRRLNRVSCRVQGGYEGSSYHTAKVALDERL